MHLLVNLVLSAHECVLSPASSVLDILSVLYIVRNNQGNLNLSGMALEHIEGFRNSSGLLMLLSCKRNVVRDIIVLGCGSVYGFAYELGFYSRSNGF